MIWHVGVHRPNDADVIDTFGGSAEQVAHFDTALAVSSKAKG